jgi:hypothetical protein
MSENASIAGHGMYVGEVVYLYAYDVAYEIHQPVPALLGAAGRQFATAATKRMPRDPFFFRPWTFDLPDFAARAAGGNGLPTPVHGTIKIFPVGAISIAVHVPFAVRRLEDLVAYHDLQLSGRPLASEARAVAERAFGELRPYCVRPVEDLKEDEAYTVFCLRAPLPAEGGRAPEGLPAGPAASRPAGAAKAGMEDWLHANRRQVAALLTQEQNVESLSLLEAMESTNVYVSYYETDIAVIDWDAALLIDEPEDFDEFLHVAELANVQLVELGVFDHILDEAVERSYRDLRRKRAPAAAAAADVHRPWRRASDVQRDLREIRIDVERLRDELFNITKFFGDWHLARVYQQISSRFHLADWSRAIEGKLRTLNEFYQILKADQNNRLMVILETLIVLLFIIDLVILVMSMGK